MSANSDGNFAIFPEKSKNAFKTMKKARKVEPVVTHDDILSDNVYMSLNDDSDDPESETERPRKKPSKEKASKAAKTPSIQTKPSSSKQIPEVAEKTAKPPPLTVTKINIVELEEKLKSFAINKSEIKFRLTKYGTKVFVNTNELFQKVKSFFIANNIEFFTHTLKEDRHTKIVLYGLPDLEIDDIKNELNDLDFNPDDIKKLNIKEQRYDFQCNYILYFKKTRKIKISDIRTIRSLFNLIVRWEYYIHKRHGPTQCSNCQGFSHGTKNCHLAPKCIRCGQDHKSAECPLLDKTAAKTKTPIDKLRCANCGLQHVANYSKCPKRLEIIRTRKFLAQNSNRTRNFESRGFNAAPQLNDFNFPSLTNQSNGKAWSNTRQQFQNQSVPNQINQNDLLSPNECFTAFNEFLTQLSQCTSRVEQLQVIGQITLKYLSK
jgi:hypothetical protein